MVEGGAAKSKASKPKVSKASKPKAAKPKSHKLEGGVAKHHKKHHHKLEGGGAIPPLLRKIAEKSVEMRKKDYKRLHELLKDHPQYSGPRLLSFFGKNAANEVKGKPKYDVSVAGYLKFISENGAKLAQNLKQAQARAIEASVENEGRKLWIAKMEAQVSKGYQMTPVEKAKLAKYKK